VRTWQGEFAELCAALLQRGGGEAAAGDRDGGVRFDGAPGKWAAGPRQAIGASAGQVSRRICEVRVDD
jgi:hypothetical protein